MGTLEPNKTQSLEQSLIQALRIEIPYSEHRPPISPGKGAAVLALFGFSKESPGTKPYLLLTRRTETVETHKGQMAFPGGMTDPGDVDASATALRECEEEIGVTPAFVQLVGALPLLHTVTGFNIIPILGLLRAPIEDVELKPNTDEIADMLWIPLSTLNAPETYERELIDYRGAQYSTDTFRVGPHRIWGVTGAIVRNILDRLAQV